MWYNGGMPDQEMVRVGARIGKPEQLLATMKLLMDGPTAPPQPPALTDREVQGRLDAGHTHYRGYKLITAEEWWRLDFAERAMATTPMQQLPVPSGSSYF